MGKSGSKRTKTEREHARAEVARLDRKGYGQIAIARKLRVSQPQVCYDLKVIRKRFVETQMAERGALVAEKLEQYRGLLSELWDAWERSKKGQLPENAYMESILRCLAATSELLGLYGPKKMKAPPTINWHPES